MAEMLSIGSVKLKNRLLLAPLVEVSDLPYRMLCRRSGAAMAYVEMLNISSILHENQKTKNLMRRSVDDTPSGIQITGKTVEEFEKVIPHIQDYDIVDINCGCPSIRITENGTGSFLLKEPEKIGSMIRTLKDAGMNVTAKIRLGFKQNNVMDVAKSVERAGADALTIHARLGFQGRSIPADWSWIEKVKRSVGIPVIGNGDVFSSEDAERMLGICDGVMIARGAIGDPLIFERILHYLKTGEKIEFDVGRNMKMFKEYLSLEEKFGFIDVSQIKYVGANFIKSFKGASELRNRFMKLRTYDEILNFVENIEVRSPVSPRRELNP